MGSSKMKVAILAENYALFVLGIKAERGLSVFIEKDERSCLYDTGQFDRAVV